MPAILDNIASVLDLNKSEGSEPSTPVFDSSKVTVVYVLGGPGAGELSLLHLSARKLTRGHQGKGTQCARLVEDFGFCHLSGRNTVSAHSRVFNLYIV